MSSKREELLPWSALAKSTAERGRYFGSNWLCQQGQLLCFEFSSCLRYTLREKLGRGFVAHATPTAGRAVGWENVEFTLVQVLCGSATIRLQACFL